MLNYLVGTATQGAADAYVEAEIATALSGLNTVSYRVREILLEFDGTAIAGDQDELEIALSRRTKAAMPLVTDRDVIAKWTKGVRMTTSGTVENIGVVRLTFTEDDDLRIVEDPIYLQVDSASIGAALTISARIGYERVNISALDRLTLLTNSLAE